MNKARLFFLVIGLFLLITNVIGMFISLRNDEIYTEPFTKEKDDITLTEKQLWERLNRRNLNASEFASLLNDTVNKGMAHYWLDEGITKYNLRVPFYENYLLYIASWIYPPIYEKYEFSDYKKAMERGVGTCSQHAIVISEISKKMGIPSKIVALDGHVVATVEVDKKNNQWWILDGDYGVVLPYNISQIERDPSLIKPFYSKVISDEKLVSELTSIYGPAGNVVTDSISKYDSRIKTYAIRYYIERVAYILKWLLPLLLIMQYVFWLINEKHKKSRRQKPTNSN